MAGARALNRPEPSLFDAALLPNLLGREHRLARKAEAANRQLMQNRRGGGLCCDHKSKLLTSTLLKTEAHYEVIGLVEHVFFHMARLGCVLSRTRNARNLSSTAAPSRFDANVLTLSNLYLNVWLQTTIW